MKIKYFHKKSREQCVYDMKMFFLLQETDNK
jgi:hypothetical protein